MKLTSATFVAVLALVAFYIATPKAKAAGNENYSYSNLSVNHSNRVISNNDNDVCRSCGEVVVNKECNCQPIVKEIRVPVVNVVRCQRIINVPCVRPVVFRKVFVPKTVCVPQIVINRSCPVVTSGCPAGCP